VTHDNRLVYCTAALAIVYDPKTRRQSYFEAHTDDVSCVCLHPRGKLACTGQVASAVANSSPWLAVWDVDTLALQQTVGYVADESKKDGSYLLPPLP
jgi:WD40 repeat protein